MYLDDTDFALDLELDICVSFGRRHYFCEGNEYVEDTMKSMAIHGYRKTKRKGTDAVCHTSN
jgi:hypothetical protein